MRRGIERSQIVNYHLDALHLPGVLHRERALIVLGNKTGECNDAAAPGNLEASHAQPAIGAHPVLHFGNNVCIVPTARTACRRGHEHNEDAEACKLDFVDFEHVSPNGLDATCRPPTRKFSSSWNAVQRFELRRGRPAWYST